MNLKKVNVELSVTEVQEILAIDMDDDARRALAFIKGHEPVFFSNWNSGLGWPFFSATGLRNRNLLKGLP